MNSKKYPNLKPWQPGQSGNPAGRKPGSKNVSTIVRELLDQEANPSMLAKSNVADQAKGTSITYAKAVVLAAIHKALEGNMQAISWLADQQQSDLFSTTREERLMQEPLVISHFKPRYPPTVD